MVDKRDTWTKENLGYKKRMPRHFPTEYLLRSLCSKSYFNLTKDIAAGHNCALPFPDGSFDFLLSINTIHYEDGTDNMMAGLREFARVGKPECHFLISTAGPDHHSHANAERLGPNRYRLKTGEFRDGQVMSYFDGAVHFRSCLEEVFGTVEIAEINENYPASAWDSTSPSAARPKPADSTTTQLLRAAEVRYKAEL